MTTINVLVRTLSGDLFQCSLEEGATGKHLLQQIQSMSEFQSDTNEYYLVLQDRVGEDEPLQADQIYSLLVQPIEWRILLSQWQHLGQHRRWTLAYHDLTTHGRVIIQRGADGNFELERGAGIRYLYDPFLIGDLIDVINPWDYGYTNKGIQRFLTDHITMYATDQPFQSVDDYPSVKQKYDNM